MFKYFTGVAVGASIVMLLDLLWFDEVWYKTGHIDALRGKICYELRKQKDLTVKWEKIEPCADHAEIKRK